MDLVISCCCPRTLFGSSLKACHLPFRFTGVSWSALHNRWAVYLTVPTEQTGRREFLGCFDTDEEAATVADKYRIRHVRLHVFEIHTRHCNVSDIFRVHNPTRFQYLSNIYVCVEYFALLLQVCQISFRC